MQTGILALLGLATLFVGWILTLVLPGIRYVAWGVLTLGAILVLVAFVIDYRRVGGALASRRGRFSTGTTLMVSVFIGIILLVNAISIGNFHRFDVTGLSQYTLTSQTRDVLVNLKTPVKVVLFTVPSNDPYGIGTYATALLEEYKYHTDKLDVETIDPDEQPDQARQYGLTEYHSAVFIGENGQRLVPPMAILAQAEHSFTSAILEVTGTVQKRLYFVTGHEESSIYDTSPRGYSNAREGLLDNLYQVALLDLLAIEAVPDDAAALILAGPQESLSGAEMGILQDYVEHNGRLLIMANPASEEDFEQLLLPWGAKVEQGFVWESGDSFAAPSRDSPVVPRSQNLFGFTTMYFPGVTSISLPLEGYEPTFVGTEEEPQLIWIGEERIIQIYMLAMTSEDSWLENSGSSVEPQFDEGVDVEGPIVIGVLVTPVGIDDSGEAPLPVPYGPRLLLMGDSDFATNKHFLNGNNSDFFLSSIEFLTAGTELISIDQKFLQTRRLIVGPEAGRFITISSMGLLPLLVLVAGAYIWWRRR